MARIRTIKPEAPKSLTLASWPREVRLAWLYLSMYLDDSGRGVENLRSILGECFPNDPDVTERKLSAWLALMSEPPHLRPHSSPALCRYEVDSVRYIHAPKFLAHQRISHPTPSRIPPCPIHESDGSDS